MNDLGQNDVANCIKETFIETLGAQGVDVETVELSDDTILLDTGLDSLGFAILVTRLEEELDYDPFSISTDAFYPQTFGEFVKFYIDNKPQ